MEPDKAMATMGRFTKFLVRLRTAANHISDGTINLIQRKQGSRRMDGDRTKAQVVDTYNSKNTQEGRVKEQNQIDKHGLKNLDNKRNEIRKPKHKKTKNN